MTIKQITMGACLVITSSTFAQDKTYTVKQGDTLSEIASKFGVASKAILSANHLPSADKLKLGQVLQIPQAASTDSIRSKTSSPTSGTTYTVQSGDNDESIAKKLGITAKELRVANLGTNWTRLQIGQSLAIPMKAGWFDFMAQKAAVEAKNETTVANIPSAKQPATLVSSMKPVEAASSKVVQRTYTVHNGDNDWIIAKRLGLKPSQLRSLNPGIKWTNLKIGAVLKVPGTKVVGTLNTIVAKNGPNLPRLRSRYAVVTGDAVTVRRGPSMRFDSITKVDRGTRVLVLDRDGSWYKLRFPRGTEAWVRGDFLAPTQAPQILAANTAKKSKKTKKSTTVVASKTLRPAGRNARNGRSVVTRRPTRDNGRPLVVASGNGSTLLDKADSFLGVRYRYGAASRSSTDCSGFVGQVFRSQGVKLPRTAREQSGRGQKVSKGELKPGDAVFFNTRGSRVSHVGIYKGNGQFIHASSGKGKVMVSSLNDGYYNRRFAGARRFIANKPAKKSETKVVAKKEAPKSLPADPVTTPVEPKVSAPPATGGDK
ncbi:MAG: LysM peptidoglycan-binding domain-containing protein [Chlorobia bacterium]|nr:LysM peptidoglycan-binding domain-containing protein [Fimbriimonadaceae bacterium]